MPEIAARLPDRSRPHSAIGTFVLAVKRAGAAYVRWRLRRKTARMLSGLSDDMLKDLGVTRSDLCRYRGKDTVHNRQSVDRRR